MRSDSLPVALRAVREGVLARSGAAGPALRERLCETYERVLAALPVPTSDVALVAVGSLARIELAPRSDLDLVLLFRDGVQPAIADRVWYPIWDSGLALDHAVRTVDEAVDVARADLPALLGMVWARPIAGDMTLGAELRERVRAQWRATAPGRMPELRELCTRRWDIAGDAAVQLEPDVKQARGGLRDGQVLQALALAHLIDVPERVRHAHGLLLDIRDEMHRHTGRAGDVLRRQDQQAIARSGAGRVAIGACGDLAGEFPCEDPDSRSAGGVGAPPAGEIGFPTGEMLLRAVRLAARAIGYAVETATRTGAVGEHGRGAPGGPRGPRTIRFPLARDLVDHGGQVALARGARLDADPVLPLRAARAAAEDQIPIAPYLLQRFGRLNPALPRPWPREARDELVRLLGAGPAAVPVIEELDRVGLWGEYLPCWSAVRGRPQHSPVHRHTVDRHLLETAAIAARHTRDVPRPDLLLVAALLHDIGKDGAGGHAADHARAGAETARDVLAGMGFPGHDRAIVSTLIRHHLLLVDTATGRDLTDPDTLADVGAAIGGSEDVLDLLYALTVADAEAAGPAAWTAWRARLVGDLVRRVRQTVRGGSPLPPADVPLTEPDIEVGDGVDVTARGQQVTVVSPAGDDALMRIAAVFARRRLDVRAAAVRMHEGRVVGTFALEHLFGTLPDLSVLRLDLTRALGAGGVAGADLARERAIRRHTSPRRPLTVRWPVTASGTGTVLEIRADNSVGLLHAVLMALHGCGLRVRSAQVTTVGNSVIDTFRVTFDGGSAVPARLRRDMEAALDLLS